MINLKDIFKYLWDSNYLFKHFIHSLSLKSNILNLDVVKTYSFYWEIHHMIEMFRAGPVVHPTCRSSDWDAGGDLRKLIKFSLYFVFYKIQFFKRILHIRFQKYLSVSKEKCKSLSTIKAEMKECSPEFHFMSSQWIRQS